MADKRYDQFTAGDFSDPTKIFLIADPATGTLVKVTVAQLLAAAVPYKVYTVLLNQNGGDAPVATVLENTLGAVPIYAYNSVGQYQITATGKFTLNKTFIYIRPRKSDNGSFGNSSFQYDAQASGVDSINIFVADGTNAPVDGSMANVEFEIRVYP